MFNSFIRKWGAWRLLNQTPIDGCLLVFNAKSNDWRVKAAGFKRRHGIGFRVHHINGVKRSTRDVPADLYITIKEI